MSDYFEKLFPDLYGAGYRFTETLENDWGVVCLLLPCPGGDCDCCSFLSHDRFEAEFVHFLDEGYVAERPTLRGDYMYIQLRA